MLVEARGLRCPLPVIRLAAAVRDLPDGARVVLLATDPAARTDVGAFCRMRGHELAAVIDAVTDADDEAGSTSYTSYLVLVRRRPAEAAPEAPPPA